MENTFIKIVNKRALNNKQPVENSKMSKSGKIIKRKVSTGPALNNIVLHIENVNNLKIVNVKPEGTKKLVRKEAITDVGQGDDEEYVAEDGDEGDDRTPDDIDQDGGNYDDQDEVTEGQDHFYHDGYQPGQYQQRPENRRMSRH